MKRAKVLRISAPLLLALTVACSTSPTGRSQFTPIPDSIMNGLGQQSFSQMKEQVPQTENPKIRTYVECVAQAVAREARDETGVDRWDVAVFESKEVNAFALPGGHIGVYTGLLKTAETPDELAAVLGHEVGHVIAQHGNERISQALGAQAVMLAAEALSKKSSHQNLILAGLGLGLQFGVLLPYSRLHESEADLIGLKLMARAGFDPRQSVQLWENMKKAGGAQPPELLSTHPSHASRIENLKSHMDEALALYRKSGQKPACQRP